VGGTSVNIRYPFDPDALMTTEDSDEYEYMSNGPLHVIPVLQDCDVAGAVPVHAELA
jgi:hypothetical protein